MEILQGQFSHVHATQGTRPQESPPRDAQSKRDTYTPSRQTEPSKPLYDRQGQTGVSASKPISEPQASDQVRELKPMMVANPKLLSAAQRFVDVAHFEADIPIVDIYV